MFKLKKTKEKHQQDYKIYYSFLFELQNITEDKIITMFETLQSITDGGEYIYQLNGDGNEPEILKDQYGSIENIVNQKLFDPNSQISLNKVIGDHTPNRISVLTSEKEGGFMYLEFQVIFKDHLQEMYDFFKNLDWFMDNGIYPKRVMYISNKINDYACDFFYKKYLETEILEYLFVANNDFNIASGDNWTLNEPLDTYGFNKALKNKQFGPLPLFPFPDYSYLDDLPCFNITHFPNKSAWIQLVEDVCLWEEDTDYNEALLKFVDAYIIKRDNYFNSLPIEEQEARLAEMKPISTEFMSYQPLPKHIPKDSIENHTLFLH
ncbi:MAG: hypothetical protein ACRCXZ_02420 [Patescibacteria group bacterium]